MRKKGKSEISKIQRELWQLCRQVSFKRFGPKPSCYTCNAPNLEGSNCQLGHLWSKASLGASLKYDLRVLRFQCFRCNINCGGQGADFYARMLKEIGAKAMKKLEAERQIVVKAKDHYLDLIEKYKAELK